MSKPKLYAHVVLDRSGSMGSVRESTIDAFNEYLNGLAVDANLSARISLTIFDSESIDLIRDNLKAKDAPKLTATEYVPRGGTPLYDAIGKTVAAIDAQERRDGENVALVVLTDGMENQSREHTKESIKALLGDRQKNKNWLVIYLGANQDAFAEGAKFGTAALNTMSYTTANMGATMKSAHAATSRYAASGLRASAAFTDDERKASVLKR